MQDLFAANVVVFDCAGDDAQRLPPRERSIPDSFPAVWSSEAFPHIVAGAAAKIGDFTKFSRGVDVPQNTAWAPGDGVACASNVASLDQAGQGTAFAAGMVRTPVVTSFSIPTTVEVGLTSGVGCRSCRLPPPEYHSKTAS